MSEDESEAVYADPEAVFKKYKDSWYNVSTAYWSKQEVSVNGMLGGFQELTGIDIMCSRDLIAKYQNPSKKSKLAKMGNNKVADCGAGIGRVSHYALCDYFKSIDLIDPVSAFLEDAKVNLKDDNVEFRVINSGIQDWEPDCSYDAFWVQWAIMYLTDDDAIKFLKKCKEHLNQNGYIFVKDNISSSDLKQKKEEATFYVEDRGICRVYQHYLSLFKDAELKLIEAENQPNWPKDLIPLYTFVLQ